jgi:hypothetical protein
VVENAQPPAFSNEAVAVLLSRVDLHGIPQRSFLKPSQIEWVFAMSYKNQKKPLTETKLDSCIQNLNLCMLFL